MIEDATIQENRDHHNVRRGVSTRMKQVVVTLLIQGGVLFAASGRLGWVSAWIYLAASALGIVINGLLLLRRSPEMIAERSRIGEGAKGWDKWLAPLMSVFPLLSLLVAGLDVRRAWSGGVPIWVHALGLAGYLAGSALWGWAMFANPFFSGIVRIQRERNQSVTSTGPYRFVRHPGYLGFAAMSLGAPLLLGSWWGLLPGALTLAPLIVRTALEDKTLRNELDGYLAYSRAVRFRLLPGIW